jgi:hypothetical protein
MVFVANEKHKVVKMRYWKLRLIGLGAHLLPTQIHTKPLKSKHTTLHT